MNGEIEKAQGSEFTLVIPDTESLGQLKNLKEDFSLTTKYKSADDWAQHKDKPLRAFFMGLKDVPNDDGESVSCGVFVTETEIFLSGQMILVDAVKSLNSKTPVEITYRGKKNNKSGTGSTMMFDVVTLAQNV